MKCLDCGNDEIFVEATIEYSKVYYTNGEAMDSKSLDCEDADIPRECYECASTNIDEELNGRVCQSDDPRI